MTQFGAAPASLPLKRRQFYQISHRLARRRFEAALPTLITSAQANLRGGH